MALFSSPAFIILLFPKIFHAIIKQIYAIFCGVQNYYNLFILSQDFFLKFFLRSFRPKD